MNRRVIHGLVAGATGSAALNISTYLDMLVRARPSSSVPARTAEQLADAAGIEVAPEGDEGASNRTSAAGALLGYASGLGIGAIYGVLEPRMHGLPLALSGLIVGAAAMAGSDVPATVVGATNPRRWGTAGWMADIVPHAIYGYTTVAAYRLLRR